MFKLEVTSIVCGGFDTRRELRERNDICDWREASLHGDFSTGGWQLRGSFEWSSSNSEEREYICKNNLIEIFCKTSYPFSSQTIELSLQKVSKNFLSTKRKTS